MPKQSVDFLKEALKLEKKVESAVLPAELRERALEMVKRLTRMARHGEYSTE